MAQNLAKQSAEHMSGFRQFCSATNPGPGAGGAVLPCEPWGKPQPDRGTPAAWSGSAADFFCGCIAGQTAPVIRGMTCGADLTRSERLQ